MDHTETLANEDATDASVEGTENQASEAKTYTQEEVDNMMARMKGSLQRKLLKPYEDLGDPEELRELKAQQEKQRQEEQLKRGEFEKTLQELAQKKDAEIQKRDSVIKEYKVNTPLLNAAAKYRSVNPEQVKALLASNLQLNEHGEVDVLDTKGNVRYSENGTPIGVDDLVKEFLDANPHFVQPTPSTTNTKSSYSNSDTELDVSKIDFTDPQQRAKYAEYRKSRKA